MCVSIFSIKTHNTISIDTGAYILENYKESMYTVDVSFESETELHVSVETQYTQDAPDVQEVDQEVDDTSDVVLDQITSYEEHKVDTNRTGESYSIGYFSLTAYCPCYSCSEGYGHSTATGAYATPNHTVAVDPKVIPYGTHLLINGQEYVAEDCGGGIKNNKIDIFFETHDEVRQFGLSKAEVFIIP